MKNRKQFSKNISASSKSILILVVALSMILTFFLSTAIVPFSIKITAQAQATTPLDPLLIPKYTNQLAGPPPVHIPTVVTDPATGAVIRHEYSVDMAELMQQILPTVDALGNPTGYAPTKVWGYGGQAKDAVTGAPLGYILNAPGPTFEAIKGIPTQVSWNNLITTPYFVGVDPTVHMANPNNMPMPTTPFNPYPPGYAQAQSPVPLVTHLHGGEISSRFDGGPDAWWTANGIHGPGYNTLIPTNPNSAVYYYENTNQESTLWYHDHALGVTRLNTISGLAGFYFVRETGNPVGALMPTGKYDVPLAIQDRLFNTDGSLNFPTAGVNPNIHPYWIPEFFGDTIMVNGLVWPNMNVDQGVYRFRLLDGSNARFYTLSFVTNYGLPTETTYPFTQIASDGGYLSAAVATNSITFSPGERVEVLFDFSQFAPGTTIILKNTANENFPFGAAINPNTVGQIMQFTVQRAPGPVAPTLPAPLNPGLPTFPNLPVADTARSLTLIEVLDALTGAPLQLLLDGQEYVAPSSEIATAGSIEEWTVVNPTADSHPIHTHLVTMQVIGRQDIDIVGYIAAWDAANGPVPLTKPTVKIDPTPYLVAGTFTPASPSEMGWKDTVEMHPNQVTIVRMRFAPNDAPLTGAGAPTPGVNLYPFDPSEGPGYVWHCHILDHEDNEMMRPLLVNNPAAPQIDPLVSVIRGPANEIQYATYDFGTATWSAYVTLPGQTIDAPSATVAGGILYMVVKGLDGISLWFGSVDLATGAFSGWTWMTGSTPVAPTLTTNGRDLALVVRGEDNSIYYRMYGIASATWGSWIGLAAGSTNEPIGASMIGGGDRIYLVVKDAVIPEAMWLSTVNVPNNALTPWEWVPGSTPSTPALTDIPAGTSLILAVKGSDNGIYVNGWYESSNTLNMFANGVWVGWMGLPNLPDTPVGGPAAVANNEVHFMIRGASNTLWYGSLNMLTSAFSGWTAIGVTSPSDPALAH